ncbi:polyribonucleotide nucleotidyltransferase [Candidatus Uhrbacteria bacterium RIFCSPLOWO2_01_FULL_47_24]|uniref:Polyribonucleotide nucleotidyltransferase n=1 Tax=Candidatus Uhrbacteria bacterium RIFCSPLOWO2_01_FULL_47_24 TaxID=1802401 RepID=A0A1F7UUV2_9BACT|nr:MAG: polyribonucleotide nucleotidyltransferase [Candidatus Uhrbacteria bacterium RIFCSPHIGHO2_01_FULL_47_11]OGL69304.1 MAG: polyribonucleotide nucleotidyltransferase [Candidatus Uhrbacteria bacterium RIFCSPHIGHO2_02_FULL_46_47]OGL76374.1 MAG: polyribonucleotide nucleotidyltransferase [Candidatus Uhrbacteria bacterium RIFCSPHIGHO2_12_FULL_47_11]OGL82039.1 MAG: polyribonucleotide nucleotidyltransferase [Candidatus Uhrbacteria bacterium RIFCSPLOWO2_01_FULL_47_24]OGL85433.1 MAG: polyribonucleoti
MSIERFETNWGGKNLIIETGKLAHQANGSCTVQYGDTLVLATAVMSHHPREVDFLPLSVEYEEKLYAAGKIKSSRFIKREGRPSDEAILTGRLIDRSIRPLFPATIRRDIQVILTVFSVDGENDSDIPALIAASCAIMLSDIPWDGPIAGARVGFIPSAEATGGKGGEWVLNPTFEARGKSKLDLVVSGTDQKVLMLEAGSDEMSEELIAEGIEFGQKHLRKIITLIEEVRAKAGKPKRSPEIIPATDEAIKLKEENRRAVEETQKFLESKRDMLFAEPHASKIERRAVKDQLYLLIEEHLAALDLSKDARKTGLSSVEDGVEKLVTQAILREGKRVDGRGLTDVRPLKVEVAVPPRTHGSALFSRGDTQVLSTVTLGAPGLEQTLEGMDVSGKRRFFHHYNFPPYSVGETGRMFGPGRREVGHGALAERALWPMLPTDKETFPYTIRVVSEVLASNGSSSMGSTCASSLALMDAGVPIKKQVAGIAMGLASTEDGQYKIITDLQDLEDGKGGMDFKVAGTRDGVTAIQLDTKTKGLTQKVVRETFAQAKEARMKILDAMDAVIATPRAELSKWAPRIISFRIPVDRIRDVIGPGGKMINEIIDATGVTIDIEDDGLVMITSTSPEASDKAVTWIKNLTREVKAGEIFEGKVTRIMDFGAFVEVLPKQEGLVHISELAHYRVNKVTDVLNIGDTVKVKVNEIDEMGRINLSRKALIDPGAETPPPGYGEGGGDRGGFSSGRGGRPPHRGFGFGGRSRRDH